MPSSFQIMGSSSTADSLNTKVRRKEMMADTMPSFSAVKKEELKMLNPTRAKATVEMRKACTVIWQSTSSYPTNSLAMGTASAWAAPTIKRPPAPISSTLFFSRFFSSP